METAHGALDDREVRPTSLVLADRKVYLAKPYELDRLFKTVRLCWIASKAARGSDVWAAGKEGKRWISVEKYRS